jgi:hypothetical protein
MKENQHKHMMGCITNCLLCELSELLLLLQCHYCQYRHYCQKTAAGAKQASTSAGVRRDL